MSEALQRGCVVLRGDCYGVVWDVRPHSLVLLPIARAGDHLRAHDVALDFTDLLAAAIAIPDASVRAGAPVEVDRNGQSRVGALAGPVLCRIVRAFVRAHVDAAAEARWSAERRHRHEAASVRIVHMNG